MAEEKKYSLISVEVADEEDVVRVDATGAHKVAEPAVESAAAEAPAAQAEESAPQTPSGKVKAAAENVHTKAEKHRDEVAQMNDNIGSTPVPMAGLQKGILVAVVLGLIAFFIYYKVTFG